MKNSTLALEDAFGAAGGEFLISADVLKEKLSKVKAFLFDWDGVFNSAFKGEGSSSNFNEADSMGTNLLRFSWYLKNQQPPHIGVISGERNQLSFSFSKRESFDGCYYKVADKIHALEHFCQLHNLKHEEVCFFFDDALDLSIAQVCGVRMMINRKAGVLFKNYIRENKLADYITANDGGHYGIREACELLMGLNDNFDDVLKHRTAFSTDYKTYVDKKKSINTRYYSIKDTTITEDSTILL